MTLLELGNFAAGDLSEFGSCGPANVISVHRGGGPNGGNFARLTPNDSTHLYGDTANVRVHLIGFKGGTPTWFGNEHENWRALSVRLPSGYDAPREFVADEVHGDNGTGPAPLNWAITRPIAGKQEGATRLAIRGSTFDQLNPPGGFPFEQNTFGAPHTSQYDGTYYRHNFDWAGGNKTILLDEWLHLRMGWYFSLDPAKGWFQAFARWGTMSAWREIVPRKTGIRTTYKDFTGDGQAIYPMMSCYYPVGGGGTQGIDYAAGAWSSELAALSSWQDTRLGFTGGGTPPPPPPAARPIHDAVAQVSATANPNIRHALDLIADKVEP